MKESRFGRWRHKFIVAIMAWAAVFLGGCGLLPELLNQVPSEFSLQEESRPGKVYLDEIEDVQKPLQQTQRVRELLLEQIDDSEDSFLYRGGSHYAYDSLSDGEKIWYRDMEQALGEMAEKVKLSEKGIRAGLNENSVDKIFQCVLYDHPELFYVEGYSYVQYTQAEKTVAIEFSGTYSIEREQVVARKEVIEAAVTDILSGMPKLSGDYEKARYVYETLITNTDYDMSAEDNQNIYSVFGNGVSVCQGYAKAAQYLLNRMGLFCTLVQGYVLDTGEGHAWNLVKLDGEYYYLDATWGDISYQGSTEEMGENLPGISYDYFCITTEQLEKTHAIEGMVKMPVCTAVEDNYYVRENAFFSEFDEEKLTNLVDVAKRQGRKDITMRCGNEECYRQMCDLLIEQQKIFDYLTDTGSESFAYTKNDTQWTLTFFMMTSKA